MPNRLIKPSRDIGKQEEGAQLEGQESRPGAAELAPLPPSEKSREPSHEGALHRQRPTTEVESMEVDTTFYERNTGPTPTEMVWTIEHSSTDPFLVGVERPIDLEHLDRTAGRYIYDDGDWRPILLVTATLPDVSDLMVSSERLHGTITWEDVER